MALILRNFSKIPECFKRFRRNILVLPRENGLLAAVFTKNVNIEEILKRYGKLNGTGEKHLVCYTYDHDRFISCLGILLFKSISLNILSSK